MALLLGALQSPAFKLSFTVNHAHLVPEGIEGFAEALDYGARGRGAARRLLPQRSRSASEARAGDLDFGDMFKRVEGKGFKGHYTNAFGTLDDMLWARDYLVETARAAGVAARVAT